MWEKEAKGDDITIGNGWGDGYVNLVRGYLGALVKKSCKVLRRKCDFLQATRVSILLGINDSNA